VQDGNGEGKLGMAVDRLAEDVGALVAVEGRVQNLDLRVGFGRRPLAEALPAVRMM
jgi:hypothetical protein